MKYDKTDTHTGRNHHLTVEAIITSQWKESSPHGGRNHRLTVEGIIASQWKELSPHSGRNHHLTMEGIITSQWKESSRLVYSRGTVTYSRYLSVAMCLFPTPLLFAPCVYLLLIPSLSVQLLLTPRDFLLLNPWAQLSVTYSPCLSVTESWAQLCYLFLCLCYRIPGVSLWYLYPVSLCYLLTYLLCYSLAGCVSLTYSPMVQCAAVTTHSSFQITPPQ